MKRALAYKCRAFTFQAVIIQWINQ
ncbi:hypothetical protein NC652_016168 [Populus alba x Populus x berolinensis]|nr:hypothetical protein NC652_016168 [Populus alba x Populus x berolinensis]